MNVHSQKDKSPKYNELFNAFKEKSANFRMLQMEGIQGFRSFPVPTKPLSSVCRPLSQLTLMTISQLRLQKVQKGHYLKLKVILPCFKLSAIAALCQDHTGKDCVEVSIYNFDLDGKHYDKYFPVNCIFYVKEPFYKTSATGTHIIRVDNSKDIIFQDHPEVKSLKQEGHNSNQQNAELKEKREEAYRLNGMNLMQKKEYAQAYLLYSKAIEQTKDRQYILKFLLNKAIVCLKLNLLSEYQENIDSVLKIDANNKKAIYHKIKSLILTENFNQATALLKQNLELLGKDVETDLLKFLKLQKSFKENKINWYRAIKYQELGQYFSDKIKIGKSPFGLGIIAMKNITPGDILIIQRPLLFMEDSSNQLQKMFFLSGSSNDNKMRMNMQKLYLNSEEFREKASKLTSSEDILHLQKNKISEKGTIQNYMNIVNVLQTNWFETTQLSQFFRLQVQSKSSALYEKACMLNHRCEFNCQRINLGNTIVVFAVQEVQVGEELFITYKAEYDYLKRTQDLLFWNIKCKCIFCTQQEYQLQHGTPKPNSQSRMLKKIKILQDFRRFKHQSTQIDKLYLYYDIQSITLMICVGHSFEKAAKMLRRIFPMTQAESLEILQNFMAE